MSKYRIIELRYTSSDLKTGDPYYIIQERWYGLWWSFKESNWPCEKSTKTFKSLEECKEFLDRHRNGARWGTQGKVVYDNG